MRLIRFQKKRLSEIKKLRLPVIMNRRRQLTKELRKIETTWMNLKNFFSSD